MVYTSLSYWPDQHCEFLLRHRAAPRALPPLHTRPRAGGGVLYACGVWHGGAAPAAGGPHFSALHLCNGAGCAVSSTFCKKMRHACPALPGRCQTAGEGISFPGRVNKWPACKNGRPAAIRPPGGLPQTSLRRMSQCRRTTSAQRTRPSLFSAKWPRVRPKSGR